MGPVHLLPKYVPTKLMERNITYQTIEKGAIAYLSEKNKRYWPPFPLHIGLFSLQNKKQDEKEHGILNELSLCSGTKSS
jgi:hypothetical protein